MTLQYILSYGLAIVSTYGEQLLALHGRFDPAFKTKPPFRFSFYFFISGLFALIFSLCSRKVAPVDWDGAAIRGKISMAFSVSGIVISIIAVLVCVLVFYTKDNSWGGTAHSVLIIPGLVCQKQVWRVWTCKNISQYVWDVLLIIARDTCV